MQFRMKYSKNKFFKVKKFKFSKTLTTMYWKTKLHSKKPNKITLHQTNNFTAIRTKSNKILNHNPIIHNHK